MASYQSTSNLNASSKSSGWSQWDDESSYDDSSREQTDSVISTASAVSNSCEESYEDPVNLTLATSDEIEEIEDSEQSQSFEEELISTLKPYSDAYKELNIIRKKVGDTTTYQFGLYLINDICEKLDFIIKNPNGKSTYNRIVIDNLWNLTGKHGDVNVIQLIYSYLTICDKYSSYEFAKSTFDSCPRRVKKEKYDKNYDLYVNMHKGIDQFNQLISDKFTNFCLIFKAFRTIIGKFVKHATGSWDVHQFTSPSEWKYSIWSGKTYSSKKSAEFTEFIKEMIDIYVELEKLSPELDELHAVYSEAKEESIKQREIHMKSMKNFKSRPHYAPSQRNSQRKNSQQSYQSQQSQQPTRMFIVGKDVVPQASTVSAWAKGNPLVTQQEIQIQPIVITIETVKQVKVAPLEDDGFTVVKSKKRGGR